MSKNKNDTRVFQYTFGLIDGPRVTLETVVVEENNKHIERCYPFYSEHKSYMHLY